MTITRSFSCSIPLAVAAAFALATACVAEGDGTDPEFRGAEHDTFDDKKDVGDTGGETGDEKKACPRTQGYWKNWNIFARQLHRQIPWPIPETTELCGQTWYEWLWTPPRGDAWIILVHQYIAASQNVAAGVDAPPTVLNALDAVEAELADCDVDDRATALDLSELLDAFNNGEFSEACEEDDPS